MSKIVVVVEKGRVQEIISDSKSHEFMVVDLDGLDVPVNNLLSSKRFIDAEVYPWEAEFKPSMVNKVFQQGVPA
jgi:hypothetical protein